LTAAGSTAVKKNTKITDVCNSRHILVIEGKPVTTIMPARPVTPATAATPSIAVTPTIAMMPAAAVTEAGKPEADHEFCGDSQKNLK